MKTPPTNDLQWAVAYLRTYAEVDATPAVRRAIETLDQAGVFAKIDEEDDQRDALELLAESAARSLVEDQTGLVRRDPLAVLRYRKA